MNRPEAWLRPGIRYAIPNLLTAASLILGLFAIGSAGAGQLERAAWFIVWCVLLDVVDGIAARVLNAASDFGANFDSLADLVAFGLAPAALVLHFLTRDANGIPVWGVALPCALYTLLVAVRLARFNSTSALGRGWFQGVPSTACGALIASGVILLLRHETLLRAINWAVYLPLALLALGLAMVSTLAFPKPRPASNRRLNILYLANVMAVYVCGVLRVWPEYLFSIGVLILVGGLTAGFLRRPPP